MWHKPDLNPFLALVSVLRHCQTSCFALFSSHSAPLLFLQWQRKPALILYYTSCFVSNLLKGPVQSTLVWNNIDWWVYLEASSELAKRLSTKQHRMSMKQSIIAQHSWAGWYRQFALVTVPLMKQCDILCVGLWRLGARRSCLVRLMRMEREVRDDSQSK